MKMRLALAALLLTSTSAFAADLAPQAAEPIAPIVAPVYNWTGFYAGLHAGAVFGDAKVTNPGIGSETFRNTGFIGGAHAGYNQQFDNNIVIGLEGDIDYSSLSKSKNFDTGSDKFKSDWQGSIRARAGYAMDQFLPYVTAGVAFGDEQLKSFDSTVGGFSSSKTVVGWTAGGGLEYAIDPNWIVRGEVRYTDFGKQNFNFAGDRIKVRFDEVTTELGVSYKF
jgi:outer membrane immunogenic protein